jgi:GTPase SAR1 family protein
MPANLSPEYKAAEAAYRATRDPRARLDGLREMLRTIPKHKGTERLQADLKARIKELSEALEAPRKGAGHGAPSHVVHREGAAQIALLGAPNAGKSLLHARLTGSSAHDAPYPFTTQHPEPGMMPYADIHFQLVDLPAVSAEHPVPWLAGTLQTADAALLVVDLADTDDIDQLAAVQDVLRARRVTLTPRWNDDDAAPVQATDGDDDPLMVRLPALLVANQCDRVRDPDAELAALRELAQFPYPRSPCRPRPDTASAISGPGCSAASASCACTPRRRASRPTTAGRSPCSAAKPCASSRGSCTRTSSAHCASRACGATPASTDSTSAPTTRCRRRLVELHDLGSL